jgi:hypothetical protein
LRFKQGVTTTRMTVGTPLLETHLRNLRLS